MGLVQHQRRIASWKPAPERMPREHWLQFLERHRPVGVLWVGIFLFAIAPVVLAVCAVPFNVLLILCVVAQSLAWATYLCVTSPARLFAAARIPIEPSDLPNAPRLPVTVQLFLNRIAYGEDRGVITLVDDWLIFEGERTTFSLSALDATDHRRGSAFYGRQVLSFKLTGLEADVRVRSIGVDPWEDPGGMMSTWAMREIRRPTISVLPPLSPLADSWSIATDHVRQETQGWKAALAAFVGYFGAQAIYAAHLGISGDLYVCCAATLVSFSVTIACYRHKQQKAAAILQQAAALLPQGQDKSWTALAAD